MLGSNIDTPIMYQDLGYSTMGPTAYPIGLLGGYYPSYLRGVNLPRQLDADKFQIMDRKEKEGISTAKKVAAALGIIFAVGLSGRFVKNIKAAGGIGKYLKDAWDKVVHGFKRIF